MDISKMSDLDLITVLSENDEYYSFQLTRRDCTDGRNWMVCCSKIGCKDHNFHTGTSRREVLEAAYKEMINGKGK